MHFLIHINFHAASSSLLRMKHIAGKGRGLFAAQSLGQGVTRESLSFSTLLLLSSLNHPILSWVILTKWYPWNTKRRGDPLEGGGETGTTGVDTDGGGKAETVGETVGVSEAIKLETLQGMP